MRRDLGHHHVYNAQRGTIKKIRLRYHALHVLQEETTGTEVETGAICAHQALSSQDQGQRSVDSAQKAFTNRLKWRLLHV